MKIFKIGQVRDRRRLLSRLAKKVRWTLVHWWWRYRCGIVLTQIDFIGERYFALLRPQIFTRGREWL